jgi:hypothetical protein
MGHSVLSRHSGLPGGELEDRAAVGADVGAFEDAGLDLPLAADEVLPGDGLLARLADRGVLGERADVHGGIVRRKAAGRKELRGGEGHEKSPGGECRRGFEKFPDYFA